MKRSLEKNRSLLFNLTEDIGVIYLANGNPAYSLFPIMGQFAVRSILYLLFTKEGFDQCGIASSYPHGMSSPPPLKEGDIVSVDCGVRLNGYYGDSAYTFEVGTVAEHVRALLKTTREALFKGIEKTIEGKRLGDIGHAIQQHAEAHGYGVVRELVGHGLGRKMHEPPEIPNYGKRGRGTKLKNGMTLAIEPMINLGTKNVKQLKDGWTIVSTDGKQSAHYEHDIAIVNGQPDILTTFKYVEDVLNKNS